MRIDRLTMAGVVLLVLAATVDLQGQIRSAPRPLSRTTQGEVRSMFGTRSLGYPTYPKPRTFGGGGQFGARPSLGRGFTPASGTNIWEDFSSGPTQAAQSYIRFNRPGYPPAPAEALAPFQQPPALAQPPDLQNMTPDLLAGQNEPTAGQAAQAVGPAGEVLPGANGAVGQGEAAAAPGQEFASGAPVVARNPRFQWKSDLLGGQRRESVLVERLRQALGDRLRSPLEVVIADRTATLRGVVATEHDRRLAGHVARFEPGVLRVENELVAARALDRPTEARTPDESSD